MATTAPIKWSFVIDNKTTRAFNKMIKSATEAKQAVTGLKDAIDGIEKPTKKATDAVKKHATVLGKLAKAAGRIAVYRLIRSALKSITSAAKEGINNLYQYSAALQMLGSRDAARAKETMDGFASTALYVKNSIGAALMPILQSLLPIVNAVADAFVWAANAVNQLWHAFKGETGFTKAVRYSAEYAESLDKAGGAAKELKKQIFGFDELNIFNSPSAGGGGGGAPEMDYTKMFEEADVSGLLLKIKSALDTGLKNIVKTIKNNLGQDFFVRLTANVNDILFNWSGLNKEQVAEKFLTGFYGIVGGLTGLAFAGPLGGIIGTLAGVGLGVYISTIDFNGDGELSQDEVLKMIKDTAQVLTGMVVGWTIGGPQGALIGASVGAGLTALIQSFVPEADMAFGAAAFGALLLGVIKTIAETEKMYFMTGQKGGFTTQFAILAATALTMNIVSLLSNAGFKETKQRIGVAIAEVVNIIAAAAILGCVFAPVAGAVGGALIAITIAAGLNILINSVDWNLTPQSKRELDLGVNTITKQDRANMDAYIKFGNDYDAGSTAKNKAKGKASGGWVDGATYFFAGEAGPELVGSVNGRTRVTNEEQFTAGMEGIMDVTNSVIMQAASALISAIQSKDMSPVVNISDRAIVSAYDRGKTLAGTALVE